MKLLLPPPRPHESPDPPAQAPASSPGTNTRVWLVRHAEVAPEFHGVAYGAADVPLSERGREQSRAVARSFEGARVARIYASPSERTQEMAQLLTETTGATVTTLDGLRASWGFGFRWFSPIGPLRFEWGFPYEPRIGEDPSVFEFTIGNFL